MKYYLNYKNNEVIGYSNCLNISEEFECREVLKDEYDKYVFIFNQKELNQNKINELTNWFDTIYPKYEQMFTRREKLGISDVIEDEFRNRVGENAYHNLIELYEEAEVVASEIRELRK